MIGNVNRLGQPISRLDKIQLRLQQLDKDLGIDRNATVPIASSTASAAAAIVADEVDMEELEEATTVNEVETEEETLLPEVQPEEEPLQDFEVNTEPTAAQNGMINLFKSRDYKIPQENIEVLEDGSVRFKINNPPTNTVVTVNNKGKIVSAKNVTGFMIKQCLFKDNKALISATYGITPGEGSEKADNFSKGTFNIVTDNEGNLNITFESEKPIDDWHFALLRTRGLK